MAKHRSYREESKSNWGTESLAALNIEQLNCGALLRIADAAEVMAQRHTELIDQNKRLSGSVENYKQRNHDLWLSNCALRGHITRLKKRLELYKEEHARLIHK